MPSPRPDRHALADLKASLEEPQARLEQAVPLSRPEGRPADYWRYLRATRAFYAALAPEALAHPGWASLGLQPAERLQIKLEALARDLAGAPAGDPVPAAPVLQPRSFAHALGTLYVLEGSSLGGVALARTLRARWGEALGPSAFLACHGDATAARWDEVAEALARFLAAGGDGPALLEGARETFLALERYFAEVFGA
jgi:heme oxygenase